MSNEIYRLHPVSAIISSVKALKSMILPVAIIIISNGFNFSFNFRSEYFFETVLLFGVWGVAAVLALVGGIVKWRTFVYWFEDGELRVKYGLFVKKKRYIPFERIQSLNYHEGIFHRIFGLVKVQVETAGNKGGKPEAELTAIRKNAADVIEQEMRRAKTQVAKHLDEEQSPEQQVGEITAPAIYHMSMRDLLVLATTSGGIGVVLSGLAAIVSQFSDIIPYDEVFHELADFAKVGAFLVAVMVMFVLIVAWLVSVVITLVNYYGYTVRIEDEKLMITKGLLEKKRITLPLNRIQAIRIVENPLRQVFGFATVVVESAGGNGENGRDKKIALFPLIKKQDCLQTLVQLFPEMNWQPEFTRAPKRARPFFYRIDFFWLVPIIGACSYYFYPYGLLSLLLIPLSILLGVWQHRTAGYMIDGKQLAMQYRIFSRITLFMEKKRIQSMESSQTYFQKRKQVMSIKATVMSGMSGMTGNVPSLEQQDAETILSWYEH
ncbi:PH domain-containing protein [Lysinibacillus sp. CD3-6]|uniref:PH domain-containing protein n=1 Tax=Lysinibacillus sp. CD3-6 TaxID=2892541 RepID=UPI001175BC6C|nr:PH domain-containing protein [Lysinibacillus sp. CD3-6]UED82685.1 PH domain-containing protein [Lysinibacillus sp. CD3-6]